jgi:hypothetical protein
MYPTFANAFFCIIRYETDWKVGRFTDLTISTSFLSRTETKSSDSWSGSMSPKLALENNEHISCRIICHVMSCHVVSYVMSCHVMSCHIHLYNSTYIYIVIHMCVCHIYLYSCRGVCWHVQTPHSTVKKAPFPARRRSARELDDGLFQDDRFHGFGGFCPDRSLELGMCYICVHIYI